MSKDYMKTPLVIFAYNRPKHLENTLDALSRCFRIQDCELILHCDGLGKPEHRIQVEATRKIASTWAKENSADLILQDKNLGLYHSITGMVTKLCKECGRVIVVEDDIIVSPEFIDFMLQALDFYNDNEEVYQVGGYLFSEGPISGSDSVLLPVSTTWGWATWQRAWKNFKRDPEDALMQLKDPQIEKDFNLQNTYQFSEMLRENIIWNNQSWGVWWWWNIFSRKGLVVYPKKSLVYNSGFFSSGVHSKKNLTGNSMPDNKKFQLLYENRQIQFPELIEIDQTAYRIYLEGIISKFGQKTIIYKIKLKIKNILLMNKVGKMVFQFGKKIQTKLMSVFVGIDRDITIGEKSEILEEGKIENLSSDPEKIIIGENTKIRGRLIIYKHGGKITIGDWCYIGIRSEIWSMNNIKIGDRVLIAHDVNIHDGNAHSLDSIERHEQYKKMITSGHPDSWDEMPGINSDPIVIEDDVWIGFGVTILKGIRIGARSVIASGSIVTVDVPPDSLYLCQVNPKITSLTENSTKS